MIHEGPQLQHATAKLFRGPSLKGIEGAHTCQIADSLQIDSRINSEERIIDEQFSEDFVESELKVTVRSHNPLCDPLCG